MRIRANPVSQVPCESIQPRLESKLREALARWGLPAAASDIGQKPASKVGDPTPHDCKLEHDSCGSLALFAFSVCSGFTSACSTRAQLVYEDPARREKTTYSYDNAHNPCKSATDLTVGRPRVRGLARKRRETAEEVIGNLNSIYELVPREAPQSQRVD